MLDDDKEQAQTFFDLFKERYLAPKEKASLAQSMVQMNSGEGHFEQTGRLEMTYTGLGGLKVFVR